MPGRADVARHVIGCRLIRETMVRSALRWMTWRATSARPYLRVGVGGVPLTDVAVAYAEDVEAAARNQGRADYSLRHGMSLQSNGGRDETLVPPYTRGSVSFNAINEGSQCVG